MELNTYIRSRKDYANYAPTSHARFALWNRYLTYRRHVKGRLNYYLIRKGSALAAEEHLLLRCWLYWSAFDHTGKCERYRRRLHNNFHNVGCLGIIHSQTDANWNVKLINYWCLHARTRNLYAGLSHESLCKFKGCREWPRVHHPRAVKCSRQ